MRFLVPSHTTTAALMLAAAALAGAACSSSDSPPPPATSTGGSGGSTTHPDAGWSCDNSTTLDLSGSWAAVLDLTLNLGSQAGGTATLCPEQQTNLARIVLLLQTSQNGTSLDSLQPVFCSIELPALTASVGQCDPTATNLLSVDLLLGPEFQKTLPAVPVAAVSGSLGALDLGATYQSTRFTLNAGTRKTGTSMPNWKGEESGCGVSDTAAGRSLQCDSKCVDDCSALLDDDQDGRTGVTFHVCGYSQDDRKSGLKCNATKPSEAGITIQGPLAMDFQVDPLLSGKASSSCEVRGTVDAQVVYHVVGGDMYLANSQIAVLSAKKSLPLFTVDSAQSRFRLVRVDGKHGAPDWGIDPVGNPAAACVTALQHKNDLL